MANHNVPTNQMKPSVALKSSPSTINNDVVVIQLVNGPVRMVLALEMKKTAMEWPSAKINLTRAISVASRISQHMVASNVVARKTNSSVPTEIVFIRSNCVTEKLSVLINQMKANPNVVSRRTHSTAPKSVGATLNRNGPVQMDHVF
jgi:hypothetical protein